MKKLLFFILCLFIACTPVYADNTRNFSELCSASEEEIVRINIRSGSTGRTVICIESPEIIKEIYNSFEAVIYTEVPPEDGGGRGGWLYEISMYTDIFEEPVFSYILNNGTSPENGIRYEADNIDPVYQTVKKYIDDPFGYEGIMVGSGDMAANGEIVFTVGENTADVYGNKIPLDAPVVITNDRAMIPLRVVAESLGAQVLWIESESKAVIKGINTEIIVTIGMDTAVINGVNSTLDSPAFIENNRTYIPLRFVSEAFGAKVQWNENKKQITITRTFLL